MENRKNILFISSWYPSKNHPTLGNFTEKHAEASALKNNIWVVNVEPSSKKNIERKVKTTNLIETTYYFKSSRFKLINLISRYSIFLKECGKMIRENNIKLIHLNVIYPLGIIAYLLKVKYKIRFIVVEHSTKYLAHRKHEVSWFEKKVCKLVSKYASIILPVSNNLLTNMNDLNFKGNYGTVNNVVDTSLFNLNEKSTNKFHLIHISTLNDEHKNFSGLLNAFSKTLSKNNTLHLTVITDGEYDSYSSILSKLKIPKENLTLLSEKTS